MLPHDGPLNQDANWDSDGRCNDCSRRLAASAAGIAKVNDHTIMTTSAAPRDSQRLARLRARLPPAPCPGLDHIATSIHKEITQARSHHAQKSSAISGQVVIAR
jgi:hypothetical protein